MVKIPSFARRDDSADADENRTATDETVVRDRATDRSTDQTERLDRADRPTLFGRWADRDRTRPGQAPAGPATVGGPNAPTDAERRLAGTDLSDTRATDTRPSGTVTDTRSTDTRSTDSRVTDRRVTDTRTTDPVPDTDADIDTRPEPTHDVPAGPRPRTSVMATLSLIFAVAGAFFVLSGALAGYGIVLGAIAVLLSMFAFAATRKRHVAGKLDAMLGLLIGGAAVVVGVLAFTGTFGWPTTDADWVERLRGWLDSQFVDRF